MDKGTPKNVEDINSNAVENKPKKMQLQGPAYYPDMNQRSSVSRLRQQSQNKIDFGQTDVNQFFNQTLLNLMKKYHKSQEYVFITEGISKKFLQQQEVNKNLQGIQAHILFIQKDREKQYDQKVISQLMLVRNIYNSNHKDIDVPKKNYRTFGNRLKSNDLLPHEANFEKERRKCIPIVQIIQKRIINLQILHIENKPQVYRYNFRYQVSALELFKVINANKLLTQATIKGVEVKDFQQFIKLLYAVNKKGKQVKERYLYWITKFSPSKNLRIAINAKLLFDLKFETQEKYQQINTFLLFTNFFFCCSDINVKITLNDLRMVEQNLGFLLKHLKRIFDISIEIFLDQFGDISVQQIQLMRTVLFGGLACFTQIKSLSFKNMNFIFSPTNNILAITQILDTLFKNNKIVHLQLDNCIQFPAIPKISTLESLQLGSVFSSSKLDLPGKLTQSSPNLKYLRCSVHEKNWSMYLTSCRFSLRIYARAIIQEIFLHIRHQVSGISLSNLRKVQS